MASEWGGHKMVSEGVRYDEGRRQEEGGGSREGGGRNQERGGSVKYPTSSDLQQLNRGSRSGNALRLKR